MAARPSSFSGYAAASRSALGQESPVRVSPEDRWIDASQKKTLTSSTEITSGPVVAFDGEVWLVAWVEVKGTGRDLRAAAVRPDGTVVDATSRLLAAGVSDVAPALSSTGDGSVLVLFNRPATGGKVAINTIQVEGS